jgi:hypothetical protein
MSPRAAAATAAKKRLPEQVTLHRKRYYDLHDGTKLPSVTTILSTALNKPALPGWAAKVVAEEAMANLPQLVKMSRTDRDGAIKFLKGRPYAQRDDAAAAGTKAHALAEAYVLGQPYEVPAPDTDLGKTLAQFVRFLDDWRPVFEATEAVVANTTIGYAGSLDAIARIPGLGNRLLVIDYKTSKSGPYPEWSLQTAAYARAEHLWLPDGTKVPMPAIDGAAVLRLRPNFYALHPVEADLDELLACFAAARHLASWALDADDATPFAAALKAAPTTGEVA